MGILDHPSSSGSQPGQSSSSAVGPLGIEWRKWFPPVTSRSFLSHYLPASGAISHTLYTVHLFSPNIISSLFPTGDLAVSNTILFNANVGLGFYVYFRRHLHRVNPWERVEFSVLSSTLFNFGSLLAAVLIKALFPAKSPTWLKSLTATVLSGYLLSRAAKYMGLLDHRATSGRGSVSPARSALSPRQNAASSSSQTNGNANVYSSTPRRPSSTTEPLHISTSRDTTTEHTPPPQSNDSGVGTTIITTTTNTNEEASDYGDCSEEQGFGGNSNSPRRRRLPAANYRYLHSYALSNLSNNAPKKETILRRTTNRTPDVQMSKSMCFVTPEPREAASRLEVPKARTRKPKEQSGRTKAAIKTKDSCSDDLDRYIDFAIDHAPFALVPVAVGCWWTGTIPMWKTMKFIWSG